MAEALPSSLGRVLVLSASAGAGHVRAAQALEHALALTRARRRRPPRRRAPVHDKALPRPVGYTTTKEEYMASADLLIGRPGGLTIRETLARRLPIVIGNPIPGRRTERGLLEEDAAIRGNNLPALAWTFEEGPVRLDLSVLAHSALTTFRAACHRAIQEHTSGERPAVPQRD
jgi:hypothetical protein